MTRTAGTSPNTTASPQLLASLLALVLVLLPTWLTFPATWSEGRSHGFAVAAYCLWTLWQTRSALVLDAELALPGRLVAAVAGVFWLVSLVVGVRLFHQTLAVVVLLAWAASVYGRDGFSRLWPVAAIFTLALPFWEVLLDLLQGMTVAVNHALVRLAGIPATLDGTRIHFPFGTIEVAQSCAGLSYFMSALTISVIYAHMFLHHFRARVAAVLLAVVLALVSNWIRVFGLVVIGYRSRMQSPLMEEHAFYGWAIFAVVISAFFLFTGRIERWEKTLLLDQNSTAEPANGAGEVRGELPSGRLLLWSTLCAAAAPLVYLLMSARSSALVLPETISGIVVPAGWTLNTAAAEQKTGADSLSSRWLPQMSGEQHRRLYDVTPGSGVTLPLVQVARFGYDGNAQGHELVGGNNAVAAPDRLVSDAAVGPLDNQLRMVRQAVVRERTGARLVWYWYRVAGVNTPSTTRAKLLELVRFVRRNAPSEMVAVSAPCGEKDCQQALAAVHLVVTGREFAPNGTGTNRQ